MDEIIISIKPNFVEKILCGEKTIELRTRRAKLKPGTRMWIYSTLPRGEICAMALVEYVHTDCPYFVWERFGGDIAITEEEYWEYVGSRDVVTIIKIGTVVSVDADVTLQRIQNESVSFSPPQFFMRLRNNNPIHTMLRDVV